MPIYEFKCVRCGKVHEILIIGYGKDEEDEKCECGGELKRIFSPTSSISCSSESRSSCQASS